MATSQITASALVWQTVATPRVFRIELDELTVTVHPGDNPEAVRELPSSTPPRYFLDDREVDRETFDRELEQDR